MAIDSQSQPIAGAAEQVAAIENELPTYRAITPTAIWSLVLGVFSVLGFAWNAFWGVAIVSVVLGVVAIRKIKTYPDMYTGLRYAQIGIGLATTFGLASFTTSSVQDFVRTRKAEQFARMYLDALNNKPMADAFYYYRPLEMRQDLSPQQMLEEFLKQGSADPMIMQGMLGPLKKLEARRKAAGGQKLQFVEVEEQGLSETTPYALVLFKFDAYKSATVNLPVEYASITIKGTADGQYEWYVESVNYPTAPKSNSLKIKPVDDHGDSH